MRWPSASQRLDAITVWVPVGVMAVIVLWTLLRELSLTGVFIFVAFLLLLAILLYVRKIALERNVSKRGG